METLDEEAERMQLKEGQDPLDVKVRYGYLRGPIMATLQQTVAELGPVPDVHGLWIKRVIRELDPVHVLGLGAYLDDCREKGNYSRLDNARLEMKRLAPDWQELA